MKKWHYLVLISLGLATAGTLCAPAQARTVTSADIVLCGKSGTLAKSIATARDRGVTLERVDTALTELEGESAQGIMLAHKIAAYVFSVPDTPEVTSARVHQFCMEEMQK